MSGRLWVTWERQRRNRSLSAAVGAELLELVDGHGRLLRYPRLLWRTLRELRRRKPRVLFCQSPSIVLAAACIVLRPLFRYVLVVDAHNAGILPLEGRSRVLNGLAAFSLRRADVVLVSNARLASRLDARVAVPVPDPIPRFPPRDGCPTEASRREGEGAPRQCPDVLFVCSWHADEPVDAVLEAAARFDPETVRLRITGRPRLDGRAAPPRSVELLGFVSDARYAQALQDAALVLALTTRQDSLNCAAYEAIGAGTPGVLADTEALRDQFPGGFLFVSPDPDAIARAIREGLAQRQALAAELARSRERVQERLQRGLERLEAVLGPEGRGTPAPVEGEAR